MSAQTEPWYDTEGITGKNLCIVFCTSHVQVTNHNPVRASFVFGIEAFTLKGMKEKIAMIY